MQNSLISVIILTWNRVQMLKETVESVLNQTYKNFELLIIDNESTDGTQDFINSLDLPNVVYHRNPNHGVLSINRNYGISKAKGDYLAFCDDDDLWEPEKLQDQLDFIRQHPEYKVVCSNGVYFDNSGDISRLINRNKSGELTIDDFLAVKNDVVSSSSFFSNDIFRSVGLFNENPQIIGTEDFELLIRIAACNRIYFISNCLVRYRVHDSMTSHKNALATIEKEKILFSDLYNDKILDELQYKKALSNLNKKYITAFFKEILKKMQLKKFVYSLRRNRFKFIGR